MTNNADVVVHIPIQGRDSAPATSSDQVPIQGHDPTPTPTRISSDKLQIQEHFQLPTAPPPTPSLTDESYPVFIRRILAEIDNRFRQQNNSSEKIIKIQKVPRIMFQQKKFQENYYIPREMPIGPVYAELENSEQMQLKLKLAAQFIITSGRTCSQLLESIEDEIETLKARFNKNLLEGFSGGKLVKMLLLDGCFILQFIYSRVMDELMELQINYGQASVIEQDLFLMANQIPFRVLEILMDSLSDATVFIASIDSFIRMNLMKPEKFLATNYRDFYKAKNESPLHLLDILYSGFLYGFDYKLQSEGEKFEREYFLKRKYFHNIQDLKAHGIKLEASESSYLGKVTFTSSIYWFRARLKIPTLIVDDSTGSKLWNLIAYEMCPDNSNSEFRVTSYLSLLNSLIDREEDVKDLKSAHILRNYLSCDADVAKLFHEIVCNVVSDKAYRKVKHDIQMHCDRWFPLLRLVMMMSQLSQNYFSNPWSFIALLGAIAALALTATQTYFAIHPANPADPPPPLPPK